MSNQDFATMMVVIVTIGLVVFNFWLNTKSGEKWMDNL